MARSKSKPTKTVTKFPTATTTAGKRRQVYEGRALMTAPNGLTKKDLKVSKSGKIVSRKASAASAKRYVQNGLSSFQYY